jgi:hypothetical protein
MVDHVLADTFGVPLYQEQTMAIVSACNGVSLDDAYAGSRLRLEMDISHLDDVWPWVLFWGAGAKVTRLGENHMPPPSSRLRRTPI